MKKGLFLVGLILLLIGIMFARPDDSRNAVDRIEHDEVHDNLIDNFNSTYEQIEDNLGENTDVVSYGVAMIGLLLLIVSFIRRKEKGAGLLYQSGDKQNISPHLLEKSITGPNQFSNPHTPPPHPAGPCQTGKPLAGPLDSFELPELAGTGSMLTPSANENPGGQEEEESLGGHGSHDEGSSKSHEISSQGSTELSKEYGLYCPNCGQGFSLKGSIQEVICPRCGKRFRPRKMNIE